MVDQFRAISVHTESFLSITPCHFGPKDEEVFFTVSEICVWLEFRALSLPTGHTSLSPSPFFLTSPVKGSCCLAFYIVYSKTTWTCYVLHFSQYSLKLFWRLFRNVSRLNGNFSSAQFNQAKSSQIKISFSNKTKQNSFLHTRLGVFPGTQGFPVSPAAPIKGTGEAGPTCPMTRWGTWWGT